MMLLLLFLLLFAPLNDEARRANEAYNRGDFVTAEHGYREALRNDPENLKILFNLANSLAQQGKTEEALSYFNQLKSATKDPDLRSKVDYNIGNTLAMAQQWGKAKDFFKESLRFNPNDTEAKYNYELSIQKEQEQQQQQNEQGQGDGENDQNQQQQQQDQNQQNQDGGGNQNQQQQGNNPDNQKDQDGQNQQQDQNQNQQQPPQQQRQQQMAGKMSKEEAEQYLKQAENKEKDVLKKFKKAEDDPKNKNDKDW